MKTLFRTLTLAFMPVAMLAACSSSAPKDTGLEGRSPENTKLFPFDYPMTQKLDAQVGDSVVAPVKTYAELAQGDEVDLTDKYYRYQTGVLDSVGEEVSKVNGVLIPNVLIQPYTKDLKTEQGKTYYVYSPALWSGYYNRHFYVTDASQPATPIGVELNSTYRLDSEGALDVKNVKPWQQNVPLKFALPLEEGKIQTGAPVIIPDPKHEGKHIFGIVIAANDKKAFVSAEKAKTVVDLSDIIVVELTPDLKPGDKISINHTSGGAKDEYEVVELMKDQPMVKLKHFGRENETPIVRPFTQVSKKFLK